MKMAENMRAFLSIAAFFLTIFLALSLAMLWVLEVTDQNYEASPSERQREAEGVTGVTAGRLEAIESASITSLTLLNLGLRQNCQAQYIVHSCFVRFSNTSVMAGAFWWVVGLLDEVLRRANHSRWRTLIIGAEVCRSLPSQGQECNWHDWSGANVETMLGNARINQLG